MLSQTVAWTHHFHRHTSRVRDMRRALRAWLSCVPSRIEEFACHRRQRARSDSCEPVSAMTDGAGNIVPARIARECALQPGAPLSMRFLSLRCELWRWCSADGRKHRERDARGVAGARDDSRASVRIDSTQHAREVDRHGDSRLDFASRDRIDACDSSMRSRARSHRHCTQVFLHFFLNIKEQTNYDSP